MIRKQKLRLTSDIFYGAVLWSLLLYGGGYLSYINPINIILPLSIFPILLIDVIHKRIRITFKEIYTVLFIFLYVMFLYVYHSHLEADFTSYANIVLIIVIVFLFNKIIKERDRFIALFEKVMLFICIYSCACFALNILFNFTSSTPVYGTLYKLWMGQNVMYPNRNSGPFWEPGIFQIYINIALFFSLFFSKEKNEKNSLVHVVIYVVTIFTTISTTGYIIMSGLLFWKYICVIRSLQKNRIKKLSMIFLVPIVILIGGAALLSTHAVADKFRANNQSFLIRSSEAAAVMPIIREAGPFGKGSNTDARVNLMIRLAGGDGLHNSVGYSELTSRYGWLTLLLFMIRIMFICRRDFNKQWFILYGIMLIFWTTGAVMLIPLYYFFLIGFKSDNLSQAFLNDYAVIPRDSLLDNIN